MAPVSKFPSISDLELSSLELDSRSFYPVDLPSYLSSLSLSQRESLMHAPENDKNVFRRSSDNGLPLSPMDTFKTLTARDVKPTQLKNPGSGSINPDAINMKGVQAIFALIGVSFVLGAIWFFFWAKNGGFQWRKGDWDEYKSTVLRRKGPNGTTLSNATKSTRLGGGSVVGQGYSDDGDGTMTELSSEAPIIKEKYTKKNKNQSKQTAKDRKVQEVKQEQWEGGHDNDVRAYRHERPARVGGLNKNSEAQYYGTDYSESARSDLNSNRPSHQEHRQSSSRQASPDKRQSRRDFPNSQETNYRSNPEPTSRPTRYHSPSKNQSSPPKPTHQTIPGAFVNPADFDDVQSQYTKTYHHPIPNLNGHSKPNYGYRRDRRDSLDD